MELKNILPTENEAAVTEEDVVTALTEAELTLSADPSVESDAVEVEVLDEEALAEKQLADSVAAKRNDHIQQFKFDFDFDDIPDVENAGDEDTAEIEIKL